MTVEYKIESVTDCLEEIKPLLEDHYKEVAMYQDKILLNPDYEQYIELDAAGMVHLVTARDEGTLIGYFISFILPHMHYQDHKYAVNDILFIEESYRKAEVGLKLFQFVEEALKEEGVSVIIIHMKTAIPFDSLCLGLGYDYAERNYSKYIGK